MEASVATVTIRGITPYSQSRQHEDPKLKGERPDDYDKRTWASKLNVAMRNGKETVIIPAHGLQQSIAAAAQYSSIQIPGQGKKTWTKKFMAGIAILEDPALDIDPSTVRSILLSVNPGGLRGGGKRVSKRFPVIPEWSSTFEVFILDPIITQEVFNEMVRLSGLYVGVGRFRPENGGTNGRFQVERLDWVDNRRLAA